MQRRPFREGRGCWSGGSACGSWRRRHPVGLPEEDEGQAVDRAGPHGVRGGGGAGWAGRGGREVGRGWAENQKWAKVQEIKSF
jgi:hypothetical protein